MKQFTIQNHFVPESYLKNWCNDGKINIYRILVPHENVPLWGKPKSPAAIAWQRHLYTKIVAGEESDEIENWFDEEYENPARPIIQKVINDEKLNPRDWEILIRFLAAQDVRTPVCLLNYLKNEKPIIDSILKKNMDDLVTNIKLGSFKEPYINKLTDSSDGLPLNIDIKHDPVTKTININAETYIGRKSWLFLVKGILKDSIKSLLKQKWAIVKPAKGYSFFTSDNPVIKLNYKGTHNYNLAGDWVTKKGNIIFPLSPFHAMLVEIGERPILQGSRLSVTHTIELRKFIAENAHRYIFSQAVDPKVEILKPRIVDRCLYLDEKKQIQEWHKINKKMELDY